MRRTERGRGLRAVAFLDTVGSTQIAATLGDERWQTLLRRELEILRKLLKERGGEEVDVAGDGLFALFREPAPAVRFAASATESVREIGLEIRAGIHFGEVEFSDGRPAGIVVHTGARAMSLGGAGDVIVTQGVRDLLAGGRLRFESHGTHELKGVPGAWPLFRLSHVDAEALASPVGESEAESRRREATELPPLIKRRTFVAGGAAAIIGAAAATYLFNRHEKPAPVSPPRDNRLFRLDPESGELVVMPSSLIRAAVNFLPCLAVGEGGVWTGDAVLHHVDPRDGTVVAEVRAPAAGGFPLINDVTTGHDDVWFVDLHSLYRIDPADNELLGTYAFYRPAAVAPGGALVSIPTAVAVGFGSVWVCIEDGSLAWFDVDEDLKHPERLSLDGVPSDLVVAAGALWVADEFGRILRVDPNDHRVSSIDVGGAPKAIAATRDRIWTVDPAGIVVTVEVASGRVRRVPLEGDLVDVAAGLDAIWIADRNGRLVRIDDALMTVVDSTDVRGPIAAVAVDEDQGVVWIRTSPLPRVA